MLQELVLEEEVEIRNGDHRRLDNIEWKTFSGTKVFCFHLQKLNLPKELSSVVRPVDVLPCS